MCQYTLYTVIYKDEILDKFEEQDEDEAPFKLIHSTQNGNVNVLTFDLHKEEELHLEYLAHVLSDVVQRQVILGVSKLYLQKRDDLALEEKEDIKKAFLTNNYLSRQEGFSSVTYYLIYVPILRSLRESDQFNVDGWIVFRTQKYAVLLQDLLEQFVMDYLVKKELIGFIKIMREVKSLSAPLEEVLHLIYDKEGIVRVYNNTMKDVTRSYISKYCKDLVLDSTLSREDLILNILITVCPQNIVIHCKDYAKEPQFLKTLEVIFDRSIKYCMGCSYCQPLNTPLI